MTPRNRYTFFIDDVQREGLRAIKELYGTPESEQIRRAINAWLKSHEFSPAAREAVREAFEATNFVGRKPKGVKKTERKRAVTRKRS